MKRVANWNEIYNKQGIYFSIGNKSLTIFRIFFYESLEINWCEWNEILFTVREVFDKFVMFKKKKRKKRFFFFSKLSPPLLFMIRS